MNYTLYILKLEQDRYYVGITCRTLDKRLAEHFSGYGSAWTEIYKPVRLHAYKKLGNVTIEEAERIENHYTALYMEKYGFDNVRGGNIVSIKGDITPHITRPIVTARTQKPAIRRSPPAIPEYKRDFVVSGKNEPINKKLSHKTAKKRIISDHDRQFNITGNAMMVNYWLNKSSQQNLIYLIPVVRLFRKKLLSISQNLFGEKIP